MGPRVLASVAACILLVACNGEEPREGGRVQGQDSLPAPGAVTGSVTGMPNPGSPGTPPMAAPPSTIESGDDFDEVGSVEGGFEGVEPFENDLAVQPRIDQGVPSAPMPRQTEQPTSVDPWAGQTAPIPSEPVEPIPR